MVGLQEDRSVPYMDATELADSAPGKRFERVQRVS